MMIVDEYKSSLSSLIHPKTATSKRMNFSKAIFYYYKSTLIPVIILIMTALLLPNLVFVPATHWQPRTQFSGPQSLQFQFLSVPLIFNIIIFFFVLTPIYILISAAVLQIIGKNLFRWFKGSYADSITSLVYAFSAAYSLYWIFGINLIGYIIGLFVVSIYGVANQQKIDVIYSFLVLAITTIVMAVIVGAAFFLTSPP
jgi:hypothetical protein